MAMDKDQEKINFNVDKKILVLDDDIEINKFIKTLLLTEGFNVDSVFHSHEALKLIQENDYDLLIIDITLGDDDLTGIDVIRKTKEELKKEIPSFIITASSEVKFAIDAFNLGVVKYIVKPFDIDELLKEIQEVFLNG